MTKANKLSMVRLFLVPIYILFLFNPIHGISNWIALTTLLIILITDYFDGVIARKYNEITLAGKLIDPTIDKIVTLLGFAFFVKYSNLSIIYYFIIVFREIMILGFRLLLVSSDAPAEAKMLGKLKTAFSFFLLLTMSLNYKMLIINGVDWNNIIFLCISILTLWSGLDYIIKSWKVVKDKF